MLREKCTSNTYAMIYMDKVHTHIYITDYTTLCLKTKFQRTLTDTLGNSVTSFHWLRNFKTVLSVFPVHVSFIMTAVRHN